MSLLSPANHPLSVTQVMEPVQSNDPVESTKQEPTGPQISKKPPVKKESQEKKSIFSSRKKKAAASKQKDKDKDKKHKRSGSEHIVEPDSLSTKSGMESADLGKTSKQARACGFCCCRHLIVVMVSMFKFNIVYELGLNEVYYDYIHMGVCGICSPFCILAPVDRSQVQVLFKSMIIKSVVQLELIQAIDNMLFYPTSSKYDDDRNYSAVKVMFLSTCCLSITVTTSVVYLSISLSVCLPSVCLSVCLSISLSISLSINLSVCLLFCLLVCVCPSICLSDCLLFCLSVCLSVCLSISLYISLSINLSVCLFFCLLVCVCPSICLSDCLLFCLLGCLCSYVC